MTLVLVWQTRAAARGYRRRRSVLQRLLRSSKAGLARSDTITGTAILRVARSVMMLEKSRKLRTISGADSLIDRLSRKILWRLRVIARTELPAGLFGTPRLFKTTPGWRG